MVEHARDGRKVSSRATLGFVALLALMFFVYLVVLLADPLDAQTMEGTTGALETSSSSDEGCSNPQVVETFTGTENQRTPQFQITGGTFRLSYDVEVVDPNGFPTLEADVLDDSGQPIGEGFLTFEEDGSENVLTGPGAFSLEIRADDVEYTVTVEDCGVNDLTNGEPTEPNGGEAIINIPRKPLPPTGGLPGYVMVAGSILVGAGILASRFIAQRGRHR